MEDCLLWMVSGFWGFYFSWAIVWLCLQGVDYFDNLEVADDLVCRELQFLSGKFEQ